MKNLSLDFCCVADTTSCSFFLVLTNTVCLQQLGNTLSIAYSGLTTPAMISSLSWYRACLTLLYSRMVFMTPSRYPVLFNMLRGSKMRSSFLKGLPIYLMLFLSSFLSALWDFLLQAVIWANWRWKHAGKLSKSLSGLHLSLMIRLCQLHSRIMALIKDLVCHLHFWELQAI